MKIHLIGICGTGMGSLAGLLRAANHDVRGSDEHVYPPMSTQLEEQGIPILAGFKDENLDWMPERVVVGNVCRRDHVEVLAAQSRGIAITSFPALLSELFLSEKQSVVVAGTHGKTTTSSLMAHLLVEAGRDPSFLIGGVPQNFRRSWRLGAGEQFVVEGDEYDTAFFDKKSKFLHYKPKIVILTSVEFDHADIFRDIDVVTDAFREFVERIPPSGELIVCAASPRAMEVARSARCRVTSYARPGFDADWSFEITDTVRGGRSVLQIACKGQVVGTIESGMPGLYNLENLIGVIATAHRLGVGFPMMERASQRFLGVKRRQEFRGIASGVTVIDDFAHHPTAVRETLTALKGRYGPGRLFCAFEPRSATSRRKIFQQDFTDALAIADEVALAPVFAPEKVAEADRLDIEQIARDLRNRDTPARVWPTVEATVAHLVDRVVPGDTVVVMSSGDYGGLHDRLLEQLGDPVRQANSDDKPRIASLLDRVGLKHPQLEKFWPSYLVIPGDKDVALFGCVAIERTDEAGLLRMLAVAPERRGEGLGFLLVETATEQACRQGIRVLYLVTDGAQSFFGEKLGWQPIDHKDCEYAITTTSEYRMARSKEATWMRKVL
ncbi:MAG: GNAT family N-acetyltransferase [Deltaproteobacteria bacterium]|nr:GNAT family N-acetyltransferase [Deltaproteobacteria bacterium]